MKEILKDPQDKKIVPFLTMEHAEAIERSGEHYTVLDNGKAVVVGGIITFWKDRGEAWLLLGKTKKENFISIFKAVDRFVKNCSLRRIEMVIDYDFKQGHRWAKLLGFKKEAEILKHYRPDGGDVSLYSKVRA